MHERGSVVIRSLVVLGVVGLTVFGCVSIAPGPTAPGSGPIASGTTSTPLNTPSALPTAKATAAPATPTLAPAATPTLAPENTPTAEPTDAASQPPPASPQQSPSGVENYGASTPLFNESFDDPNSGWGVGTNGGGSVAYGDDALEINTTSAGSWEWTRRMTGSTNNAMHVESIWTPTGAGFQGLLCANNDDELWGAEADGDGNYAFIKVDSQGAAVLSQGQLDALKVPSTGSVGFALDCAGTKTGSFKMQLSSAGTNEGVQWFAPVDEGPTSFDRVGIYVESIADPFALSVDYVLAFGGTGDTSPSPAEVELMTHIPADWQPKCFEAFASFYATGWQADILCQLDGGRSDYAEYTSFDTKANMDGYFQYLVDKWTVPEQGVGCDTGPHKGGYTIGGQEAGQILCAPYVTGTQLDWTHDDLLIFSQLIDLEGSYPDMYADWLIAGPN